MLTSAETGRLGDPRELVEILVRPLAEQATRSGSYYVRFLDRVCEYVGRDVTALPDLGGLEEAVAVGRLVTDRLPGLTRPPLRPRIRWAGQLIISALADLEGTQGAAATAELDAESYVVALIDAVTGLLTVDATARPAGQR
ncbi:hypothetical protein RCO28_01455 [Streptomyces sp. LHD-70]|uniref:hypothetical protein n=1 Tax=Streptomyces sp. LHD-70 TaxID=3072140 RepID=UPI0028101AB4|nr:hypothetical protein [Streptomyces sp. LHD-70]MDQ8701154.1 hypothetical protein [Streptomyces sp. LHD-70]